jgi:hypothetical protein
MGNHQGIGENPPSVAQSSRLFTHASRFGVASAWELASEGIDIKGFVGPNVLTTGQTWGCLPFHAYASKGQ